MLPSSLRGWCHAVVIVAGQNSTVPSPRGVATTREARANPPTSTKNSSASVGEFLCIIRNAGVYRWEITKGDLLVAKGYAFNRDNAMTAVYNAL